MKMIYAYFRRAGCAPRYRLTYLQRPEFGWTVKVCSVQKPMMGMTVSLASDDKDNVRAATA